MASEDVKTSESAVSTIVNLAEEAKLAREGVKAPSYAILSICKSLVAGGVAGAVLVLSLSLRSVCLCQRKIFPTTLNFSSFRIRK